MRWFRKESFQMGFFLKELLDYISCSHETNSFRKILHIVNYIICVVILKYGLILLKLKCLWGRRTCWSVKDVILLLGSSCKSKWINLVLALKKDSIKCPYSSNNASWFKRKMCWSSSHEHTWFFLLEFLHVISRLECI